MDVDDEGTHDAEKPLEGLRLVCSGEFESVSRKKLEEIIKKLGGSLTSAVSGKTNYLVVGYKLEDGRQVTQGSKYAKAEK
jgi:replication factor C subunit 1